MGSIAPARETRRNVGEPSTTATTTAATANGSSTACAGYSAHISFTDAYSAPPFRHCRQPRRNLLRQGYCRRPTVPPQPTVPPPHDKGISDSDKDSATPNGAAAAHKHAFPNTQAS